MGSLKGYYNENRDIISDQCFGAWMDPTYQKWKDLKTQWKDDWWTISIDQVKDLGNDVVDLIWKNQEECEFMRVGDDMKNWCLENPGVCGFKEGLEDRLFDNMFDIMGEGIEVFKVLMKKDTCYSNEEKMDEVYALSDTFGQFLNSIYGFDYKWDQSSERTHIKRSEFHTEFHKALKEYGHMNWMEKLELEFPDLADLLKEIRKMFTFHLPAHKAVPAQAQTHKKFDPFAGLFGHQQQPVHHDEQHIQYANAQWGQQILHPEIILPTFQKPHFQIN